MSSVVILYGGRSGEHEVSRSSASSVLSSLSADHTPILIGIDRNGAWYLQDLPDPIPEILPLRVDSEQKISVIPGEGLADKSGRQMDVDVVLPVLHGSFGEDGTMQGLLDIARLPYAGSGVLGSSVGMDKEISKKLWQAEGLPVVPWQTIRYGASTSDPAEQALKFFELLGCPLFVKPANAGSSVGVSRVETPEEYAAALRNAWKYDRKVLVEKAVVGREIECSVMGYHEPEAFPPGEIVPAGNHSFYDYDAKYLDPDGALLRVPADLDPETAEKIRITAKKAYLCVEAGGLSRVDFLLEDSTGDIFINEINTLPGMTSISLFPRMAAAGGLDFTAMLERLINGALEEAVYRENRCYEH